MTDHVLLYWNYISGDTDTARIGMESGEKLRQRFSAGGQKYKFCDQKIQIDLWDMPSNSGRGINTLLLYAVPQGPNVNNIGSASLCIKQFRQAAIADGWTDDSTLITHTRIDEPRNSKIRFANTAAQREYDEGHTPLVVHVAPESRVPTKSGGVRLRCKGCTTSHKTIRKHRHRRTLKITRRR